jgi:hypothetical protein
MRNFGSCQNGIRNTIESEMTNLRSKVIKYNSKHYDNLGSFEAINTINRKKVKG